MKIFLLIILISIDVFGYNRKSISYMIDMHSHKSVKAEEIQREMDKDKERTILDFELNKTPLRDIQNKLGSAIPVSTGDAATSNTSICYSDSDRETIQFNSGEMGGGTILTNVKVFAKNESLSNCTYSDKIKEPLSTSIGVRLGLSKQKIKKLFGEPSYKKSSNYIIYILNFERKSKNKSCPIAYEYGGYDFEFKNNKLIYFSITYVEEC